MLSLQHFLFFVLNIFTTSDIFAIAVRHETDNIPLLKESPQWLKPCRRKGNQLDECIRDTFQNMFPYLAKGIPEIAVDPFEPMHIDYVGIKKGQGPVTLAGSFKDLTIQGPSNTTAVYTKFDLKNNKLDIGLFIPSIKVDATYDLKGKLLLLPLVGTGRAKVHLKNVSTNVATDIYFPKLSGEEVMIASSMKVDFSLTQMRVYLDNLFNGNKVLGRSVNQFLNQNALLVVEELKETIGENLAVIFKKVMNDAFSHIPTKLWLIADSDLEKYNKTLTLGAKTEDKDKSKDNATRDSGKKIQNKQAVVENTLKNGTSEVKETSSTLKPSTSTVKSTEKPSISTTSSLPTNVETTSEFVESTTDEILEETEESRVDREEKQESNSNQLDQIQSESNSRLPAVIV